MKSAKKIVLLAMVATGWYCNSYVANECSFDTDCPGEMICQGGSCVNNSCDPACSAGNWCNGGTCTSCNDNRHCGQECLDCAKEPSGHACVLGTCGCAAVTDCGNGESCLNGTCSQSCQGSCTLTNQCAQRTCQGISSVCLFDDGAGQPGWKETGDVCNDSDACTTQDRCIQSQCKGVMTTCAEPPAATCDGSTRISYHLPGVCQLGDCTYPSDSEVCPNGCDQGLCQGDPCGAVNCDSGETCNSGTCQCGTGGSDCEGTDLSFCCTDACVNLSNDRAHCGQCDIFCGPHQECSNKVCACNTGHADCNGSPGCETPLGTTSDCLSCEDSCDDGNSCTDDRCDPALGCQHDSNSSACGLGDYCTVNDYCQDGLCHAGPARDCDDGNTCTTDSCDEEINQCVHQLVPIFFAEGPAGDPSCSNNQDDDCDGLIDSQDPDCSCASDPECDYGNLCAGGNCSCLGGVCVLGAQGELVIDGSACTLSGAACPANVVVNGGGSTWSLVGQTFVFSDVEVKGGAVLVAAAVSSSGGDGQLIFSATGTVTVAVDGKIDMARRGWGGGGGGGGRQYCDLGLAPPCTFGVGGAANAAPDGQIGGDGYSGACVSYSGTTVGGGGGGGGGGYGGQPGHNGGGCPPSYCPEVGDSAGGAAGGPFGGSGGVALGQGNACSSNQYCDNTAGPSGAPALGPAVPAEAGKPGGYAAIGINGDTSTDQGVQVGSGGGGGAGGANSGGWCCGGAPGGNGAQSGGNAHPGCSGGGGGGGGAAGGGSISIIARNIVIAGQVIADGAGRANLGGGFGAGGGILLVARQQLTLVDGKVLRSLGGFSDGTGTANNGGTIKFFYGSLSGSLPGSDSAGRIYQAPLGF